MHEKSSLPHSGRTFEVGIEVARETSQVCAEKSTRGASDEFELHGVLSGVVCCGWRASDTVVRG